MLTAALALMRNGLRFVAALSLLLAALEAVQLADEVASEGRRDELEPETLDGSLEGRDGMKESDRNRGVTEGHQQLDIQNQMDIQPEDVEEKLEEKKDAPPLESKDGDIDGGQATEEEPPQVTETRQIAEEEISSLEEYKRKKLQEEEKNKRVVDSAQLKPINGNGKKSKKKSYNYASVDCGAEVISVNPESTRCGAILHENRDDYMLNPCSADIWFVVKLCDIILVDTIEIANYELFSSTPESFRVYVSDRNPTTEWNLLGTFQARAERAVQSFPLDEHVYARFIKVEMVSHFGTEHYCPISLFRVLGSTMVEEYQDHEEQNEADQNVEADVPVIETSTDSGSISEGLFSSICNSLYGYASLVVSYALTSQPGNQSDQNHPNALASNNGTSNETSVGDNETGKVDSTEVEQHTVEDQTQSFNQHEVTGNENHDQSESGEDSMTDDEQITSDGTGNGLARKHENAVTRDEQPLSISTDAVDSQNVEDLNPGQAQDEHEFVAASSPTCDSSKNEQDTDNEQKVASANVPVKKGDPEMKTNSSGDPSATTPENKAVAADLDHISSRSVDPTNVSNSNDNSTQSTEVLTNSTSDVVLNTTGNHSVPSDNQNDTHTVEAVVSTLENSSLDSTLVTNGSAASPTQSQQPNQKESVFIRLGNKIKTLEANLTIISHYLEELGLNLKKFRKNSTDLQKAFEKRLSQLNDTVMQQQKQLSLQTELLQGLHTHVTLLTDLVKDLAVELRDFRPQMYYTHGVLIISELLLIVVFVIVLLWFIQKKIHVIVQNLQAAVLNQPALATHTTHATNNPGRSFSQPDLDGHGFKSLTPSPIKAKDSGFVEVSATGGLGNATEAQPSLESASDATRDCSWKGSQPVKRHSNLLESRWSLQQLLSPATRSLLDSVTECDPESLGKINETSALGADKRAWSLQTRNALGRTKLSS